MEKYSIKAAAKYLDVTPRMVYYYIDKGWIVEPHCNEFGKKFFYKSDLEDFVNRKNDVK